MLVVYQQISLWLNYPHDRAFSMGFIVPETVNGQEMAANLRFAYFSLHFSGWKSDSLSEAFYQLYPFKA